MKKITPLVRYTIQFSQLSYWTWLHPSLLILYMHPVLYKQSFYLSHKGKKSNENGEEGSHCGCFSWRRGGEGANANDRYNKCGCLYLFLSHGILGLTRGILKLSTTNLSTLFLQTSLYSVSTDVSLLCFYRRLSVCVGGGEVLPHLLPDDGARRPWPQEEVSPL